MLSSYQQHYDDADNTSGGGGQLSIGRRSPRRSADDRSPQHQVPVERRPSPLHLDSSRRSPRDTGPACSAPGRPGSGRPPISPRDAAAIALGADRRTTFASQKSFSYDVPSVEPPPQLHYRKQSEPIVGSGQRQRLAVGGGGGRLLPRLPISRPQLEQHISHLMRYRGGGGGAAAAVVAMNQSLDAAAGVPSQRNVDFVAELKELRRQICPSHKTAGIKEAQTTAAAPAGIRRSPAGHDPSPMLEPQSVGRRQTFAGQKSLSYEVNQFVQYQPGASGGGLADRLRDYLDENEIREFEIEDADGSGVSVWVPPATLRGGGREEATRLAPPSAAAAARRSPRVVGRQRAYFAEQRSFSCEAASSSTSAPVGTTRHHRGGGGGSTPQVAVAGHTDAAGRRYARESNVRLVRQSKTEAIESIEMSSSAGTSAHDGLPLRRRERTATTTAPAAADAETGGAVYRPRHHQMSDLVAEHRSGYVDGESRTAIATTSTGNVVGSAHYPDDPDRNRKSAREARPLERHSSMASGGDQQREADVVASTGRRHTTGQMRDRRHQDYAGCPAVDERAAEVKRHSRSPVDGSASHSAERGGRALVPEAQDMTTAADVVVEVLRRISPRRDNVDSGGKDSERARPLATQSGAGYATTYHGPRTSDLRDRDRYVHVTTSSYDEDFNSSLSKLHSP